MEALNSPLRTTELLNLYPDLTFPGTPYTCQRVWDERVELWADSIGKPDEEYKKNHQALMQVRYALIAHHEVTVD